jgi:predicted acylesterase/phospholipase RssA
MKDKTARIRLPKADRRGTTRSRAALLTAVVGMALAGTQRTEAQTERPTASQGEGCVSPRTGVVPAPSTHGPHIPLAITIRGGSSLGAYEAGYLYYLIETMKLNRDVFDVKVVTGASAGTINALVAAMSLGDRCETLHPSSSLFYRAWTGKHQKLNSLLDAGYDKDVPKGSLSSKDALREAIQILKDRWDQGLDNGFDIVLGASTTRKKPFNLQTQDDLRYPRQEERFALRIRGVGRGKPPVTNFKFGEDGYQQALLETGEDGTLDFGTISKLLLASSAFPLAFPPEKVSFCLKKYYPTADGAADTETRNLDYAKCFPKQCDPNPRHRKCGDFVGEFQRDVLLMDGGVFDNSPLRLAYQIVAADPSNDLWTVPRAPGPRPDQYRYLYIEPGVTSYDTPSKNGTKCERATSVCGFEHRLCLSQKQRCESKGRMCVEADNTCEARDDLCEYKDDVCKSEKKDGASGKGEKKEDEPDIGLFDEAGKTIGDFMGTSMARELGVLDEENPSILGARRLAITTRDFPTSSGHLANFFGFLDRKLLKYDFILGMHDAHNFVEKSSRTSEVFSGVHVVFPEDHDSEISDTDPEWIRYRCMRAVFDQDGDQMAQCAPDPPAHEHHLDAASGGEDGAAVFPRDDKPIPMKDFLVLVQASLDQLYSDCRYTWATNANHQHAHCDLARSGESPPVVLSGIAYKKVCENHDKTWRRQVGESSFLYMMRLLETYQFHFTDLGLDRDDADWALYTLHKRSVRYAREFSKGVEEKYLVRLVAGPALNFAFAYTPRPYFGYLTVGKEFEAGFSVVAGRLAQWFRFNMALQLQGLFTWPNDKVFATTPLVGTEFEVIHPASKHLQTRLALRAGYQISTASDVHNEKCSSQDDAKRCTTFVAQALVSAALWEHIRGQIGVEAIPPLVPEPSSSADAWQWNVLASGGWQF